MSMAAEDTAQAKLSRLQKRLRGFGSAAVAFSAGVDSTFLLAVAQETLGTALVAITVRFRDFPQRESETATAFCDERGIRHEIVEMDVMSVPGFAENPPDRCYLCKRAIFERILSVAKEQGAAVVLEGANRDDDDDYRPGRRALRELGILSPLHEAGLTKEEIRALSREMGLPTWCQPSAPCLASRFPYGRRITPEAIARVDRAERWLDAAFGGLGQLRVRIHGDMARIEVARERFPDILARSEEIAAEFRRIGFIHVALDLRGYRTGSLNEGLKG